MAQYSPEWDAYFWDDFWHRRSDILNFYGLPDEPSDDELREMLRMAYRGYYTSTATLDEASVEWWVAQYRADKRLPNSVVAHYYHQCLGLGVPQELQRA